MNEDHERQSSATTDSRQRWRSTLTLMTDDKSKSVSGAVADEAKSLVTEGYRDIAKPAATEIGKTAGGVTSLVLWPVNALVDGIKAGLERLRARVAKKLERIPPERQLAAPPSLAAKIALNYALLDDGDEVSELREMFEDLLLCAMDSNTARTAHPAFVEMIAQLTQDEAWLLKALERSEYAASNVMDHDETNRRRSLGLRTLLGRGVIDDPARKEVAISNLDRLGILRIDFAESAHEGYEELEAATGVEFANRDTFGHGGKISVTAIGERFLNACVRVRR